MRRGGVSTGSETRDSREALSHGWEWFSLHAGQRMQLVNFFLVSVAFLAAAFVTALTAKHYSLAVAIGGFGGWISWWFNRLELRTKELVKAGEAAVKHSERQLALASKIEELEILKRVETPARCFTSYGKVIGALHWSTLLAFLAGGVYAAVVGVSGPR